MKLAPRQTFVLMAAAACAVLLGGLYWQTQQVATTVELEAAPAVWDAPAALAALRAGNERFVTSHRTLSTDTAHDDELRRRTATEQHPLAVILCCSDSRVVPEFIFDQRAGSIFEVRNAGNVVDDDVLASFEYAVEHLHVPLMVVLGHKRCGAVHAVFEAVEQPLPDHLREIQERMSGIHDDVISSRHPGDPAVLDELSRKNAQQQASLLLRDSHVLKSAVDTGAVRLMYGVYDMDTGKVEFFAHQ